MIRTEGRADLGRLSTRS